MKKMMLSILIVMTVFFQSNVYAITLDYPEDRGILLYEDKSDTILYEKNSGEKFYPASTTKIMTALLVLENLELDQKIIVGDEIKQISTDSSKADLVEGEELTVKELLYGLLVVSGNDAAYTLAKAVGGKVSEGSEARASTEYFVYMMNQRAGELGAKDTHFVNPHGLHNENHYSTLNDILTITQELLKHDVIKEIVKTPIHSSTTNINTHQWVNTNMFLHKTWDQVPNSWSKGINPYYLEEVNGIKTGFTDAAGRCVVFSAQKDGMDLIGLIYHSTYEDIWQEGITLLNFAEENYDYVYLAEKDKEIAYLDAENSHDSSNSNLSVITNEDIEILLKTGELGEVQKTIQYSKKILKIKDDHTVILKKDIPKGQEIGQINYSLNGKTIAESKVYAANEIEKKGFLDFFLQWQVLLFFVILFLFFINRSRRRKRRRRKKNRTRHRV